MDEMINCLMCLKPLKKSEAVQCEEYAGRGYITVCRECQESLCKSKEERIRRYRKIKIDPI
ncbi:MAG: hypothetical protein CSYNP_03106 [Syntrophus sp. SKADARSKE-3]|nr:hypothetical protein [Syntrophus sp. SKADARSKE-3]